jgi:hypothetical protein
MFVRWKKREKVSRKRMTWRMVRRGEASGPVGSYQVKTTGKFLWSAVLVNCERRDGKPRQKIVAYLGGIDQECIKHTDHRASFWDGATRKLDDLGLDGATRRKVEASLTAVVRNPTARERAAAKEEFERFTQAMRESLAGL